ncbi:MAG: TolC family protein [Candidatus Obscuribacterales bacterium]|nr:TolC family protein [Candidatus Obscuribacterales bacterium]
MLNRLVVSLSLVTAFSLSSKSIAETCSSSNGKNQANVIAAVPETGTQQQLLPPISTTSPQAVIANTSISDVASAKRAIRVSLKTIAPLIQVASLNPVRLDATYNQPVSLKDCLVYALSENLPIKISRESYIYQRYTFCANLALFLPTNTMSWNLVRSNVGPSPNNSVALSRVFSEAVRFPVFQGGNVFYNTLAQFYREKGWHKALDATVNDTLLSVYNNYTNLLLNEALLQIRTKSVAVSEAQLALNEKQFNAGKGTRLAIMQSKTQLESDRQALLEQQVALRTAAINLSYTLNGPLAVNLIPVEDTVTETSLVEETTTVEDLIQQAYQHRPELRQYELFCLAANRTISVAAAPLQPTASFFTGYTHSSTTASGSANIAGAGVFGGLFNTTQFGFVASQTLSGIGVPAIMNIYGARALARQGLYQANQELMSIARDIRIDYLTALTARKKIEVSSLELSSAQEALRIAQARFKVGASTNLEVIEAQRDYVSAQIKQVQAIISSNQTQAQILHDTGLISIGTLTGEKRSSKPRSK